jgi:ubiquinone/menaquinone biosynthesis C-methylase UbiE
MSSFFSHSAASYDDQFTKTPIGILQRNQVLKEVEKLIGPKTRVLELNCGTGHDALWFSQRVKQVLATDISEEMIAVAQQKAAGTANVAFQSLDLNVIHALSPQRFDFMFSNFGGLNCISPEEMADFFKNANPLLTPKGELVLVIMGQKTLWERFYFLAKGDAKNAFRRNTDHVVLANVENVKVPTWYYAPKKLTAHFSEFFTLKKIVPIGLFVPPSYLTPFFKNKKFALNFLALLDAFRPSGCANYADHFLIHLQKKAQ